MRKIKKWKSASGDSRQREQRRWIKMLDLMAFPSKMMDSFRLSEILVKNGERMRVARDIATFLVKKRRGGKETPTGLDNSQASVKVSDREHNLMKALDTCRETVTLCMSSSAACRVNTLQTLNTGEVPYGGWFAFQQEFMGMSLIPTFLLVVAVCTALALRWFKSVHFSRRRIDERLEKKDLDDHDVNVSLASSGNDVLSRVEWALNLLKAKRENLLQQLDSCCYDSEHSLTESKKYIEGMRLLQACNKRIDSLKKNISTFTAQTPAVERQGIRKLEKHSYQHETAEADYPPTTLNDESCLTDVDLGSPVCGDVSELTMCDDLSEPTMTAEDTSHTGYPCFKCVELQQVAIGLQEQIAQLKLDIVNSKTVVRPQTTPTCKLRAEFSGHIERLERTALESESIVSRIVI